MSDTNDFAEGIYFNQPHEKAPDFVLGGIAVKPEVFSAWLERQTPNDHGYVRLKVNIGRNSGKPYVALDDYKPKKETADTGWDSSDDIPFAPRTEW